MDFSLEAVDQTSVSEPDVNAAWKFVFFILMSHCLWAFRSFVTVRLTHVITCYMFLGTITVYSTKRYVKKKNKEQPKDYISVCHLKTNWLWWRSQYKINEETLQKQRTNWSHAVTFCRLCKKRFLGWHWKLEARAAAHEPEGGWYCTDLVKKVKNTLKYWLSWGNVCKQPLKICALIFAFLWLSVVRMHEHSKTSRSYDNQAMCAWFSLLCSQWQFPSLCLPHLCLIRVITY